MKILFIGSVKFSETMLMKLIDLDADIIGCVTTMKAGMNADYVDLSGVCEQNGIACLKVENINEKKNIDWIKNQRPDIIFCLGFSTILKEDILNIPARGVVGYHPSLLPRNRGRHPLIWALVLGLKETGSTFFFMNKEVDSGDIIDQKRVVIKYEDNAASLYMKICETASSQLCDLLTELEKGTYKRIPQEDGLATFWRRRIEEDGKIDFRMTPRSIYNLVRALSKPYPGAHVTYKNKSIKIWESEEANSDGDDIEYGKVLDVDGNGIVIKCLGGAICFKAHGFDKLPEKGEYIL